MSGGARVWRALAVALVVTGLAGAGLAGGRAAGAAPAGVGGAATGRQVPGGSYGEFTGLTPARVLDARYGLGTPSGQPEWMTSGDTMEVQIGGRGGVPASGVTAVVLTVTVEAPPFGGYLTIWPAGTPRPEVSNLNWGWRGGPVGPPPSNLVTVPLGSDGKVSIYTQVENGGGVSPILDVAGYYADEGGTPGARYRSLEPARLFDTRSGHGPVDARPVGPGEVLAVDVTGVAGVPSSGVRGLVLNLTATNPTTLTYLTVSPGGQGIPLASNLGAYPERITATAVAVSVPASGIVNFTNALGSVDVIADVVGYYATDADGEAGRYVSLDPTRITDTRTGGTGPWGRVDPWVQYAEVIAGQGGIPDTGAAAVVMNLTVTRTTAAGWITVHPDVRCGVIPEVSSLNFRAGDTVANLVVARLATADSCLLVPGASYFRNGSPGYVDLLFDVAGYFTG